MPDHSPGARGGVTLALCTLLHTFTHAYGAMLVPLYLLMRDDLHLSGVKYATLIVTVYGVVYSACSYGAGILADRFNRKDLLGWGLVLNAIAIALMGLTRRYDVLIGLAVAGGLAGTLFHPAANALIPAHFPKSPGMAIGLLGIGSGLGFFFGPQYAGWRAIHASWHFASVANWQKPCIELGAIGLLCGLLFLILAREAPGSHAKRPAPQPLGRRLRWTTVAIAMTLGARDFSGVASVSLVSIYLQKAQHLNAAAAGFIVGAMMLIGVVANPLAVWVSPGRLRLPMLAGILVVAGAIVCTIPWAPARWVLPILCGYQACQLGSYAMSDAGMLERVPAALRGRVVGLFLSLAGTAASMSPWVMGFWIDTFGLRASDPMAYVGPFALLGGTMWFATLSTPLIAKLGVAHVGEVKPVSEIMPRMVEPVM
ncbi:MAG TPA: MFS transporter [Tepidisphaeraceae bacterium]|jgi:MFS family permease